MTAPTPAERRALNEFNRPLDTDEVAAGSRPMKPDRARYLEPSPHAADARHLIGKVPRSISKPDLQALGHPESPIKAIRAKCLDCSGGSEAEARKCVCLNCPLWPFRMGANPFHKSAKLGDG